VIHGNYGIMQSEEVTALMPGGGEMKAGRIPATGRSFEPSGRTWLIINLSEVQNSRAI
jgi:hypothetical protein